ncbi:MAG: hypothetical protein ACREMX_15095, partial [Gemmatimonadales bacterium]
MGNFIERLARLSRPARLGLVVAGTVVAGAAAATLASRSPKAVERTEQPSVAGVEVGGSEDIVQSELEQGPTPIELEVDPEVLNWPDEHSVEISGTTAIDAQDPRMALTVVSPSGRSYRLDPAPVGSDGSFATTFELNRSEPEADAPIGTPASRPRVELGRFQVSASSPGGFGSASAAFTVQRYSEVEQYDWKEPADRLAQRGLDLVANLKTCLGNMAVSPAREELRRQVGQLEAELRNGGPSVGLGSFLAAVMTTLGDFPEEVAVLEELLEPLEAQLKAWGEDADRLEKQIRHDGQRCSGAGTCDRADLIAQDLDVLTELMALLRRPVDLIGGYRLSAELKEELRKKTMPDLAFFHQKLDQATAALDDRPPMVSGSGSLTAWFTRTRSAIEHTKGFAQRELFQPYCQKFAGPVSAWMAASFKSKRGKVWWRYEIALEGQLTLRYPTTVSDPTVAMTGELSGCATRFKSWDDALRVGWPKLMAGALLFRTAKEPFSDAPGGCARFDLPVKAELRGSEIELTVEGVRTDYGEPKTRVRYVVVSPFTVGLPVQTSFELPYKSAQFILTRVLEDKPLKLRVRNEGKRLVVATELKARRGSGRAEGTYG